MSLLTLRQININFGGHPLFNELNFQINSGEHLCIIGRNGSGKSTLLKIITRQLEPDSGNLEHKPNLQTAYLNQEIPQNLQGSIFEIVADGLGKEGNLLKKYEQLNQQLQTTHNAKLMKELEALNHEIEFHNAWKYQQKIETVISQLGLQPDVAVATLSGGLTRRVLLARALVRDPDILVLDEPTNHLDIESINWLENFLANYKKTLIFVSHDRSFMQALASRFIEIDNQQAYSYPGNYQEYLKQKEALIAAEETAHALFDKKLAEEEAWIRQGIKARRTRNEGRVRALKELRSVRAKRIVRSGTANIEIQTTVDSGKIVFEANNVSYLIEDKAIIKNFSATIVRKDKIGIIGPNGSGKTTLLKLFLKELSPTIGELKQGTNLTVTYFDQYRHQLDEEKTVQENVYNGDMIPFEGKSIHAISYLQKFLFSPQRSRTKVKVLSGGERNRLLLAKLFTQSTNVLIMDEPTNDLDIETLELLEEQLANYQGTLLLVSHDREFLNNVVTSTLVLEGGGEIKEYVGGYDDWLRQRSSHTKPPENSKEHIVKKAKSSNKLSYNNQRELDQLPELILTVEAEIETLQKAIADPKFHKREQAEITEIQQNLIAQEKKLAELYARWENLEGSL